MSIFMLGCIVSNIAIGSLGSTITKTAPTVSDGIKELSKAFGGDDKGSAFRFLEADKNENEYYVDLNGKVSKTDEKDYSKFIDGNRKSPQEQMLEDSKGGENEVKYTGEESLIRNVVSAFKNSVAKGGEVYATNFDRSAYEVFTRTLGSIPIQTGSRSASENSKLLKELGFNKIEGQPLLALFSSIKNEDERIEELDVNSYVEVISVDDKNFIYDLFRFEGLYYKGNGNDVNIEYHRVESNVLNLTPLFMNTTADAGKDTSIAGFKEVSKSVLDGETKVNILKEIYNAHWTKRVVKNSISAAWDSSGITYWFNGEANVMEFTKSAFQVEEIGGYSNYKLDRLDLIKDIPLLNNNLGTYKASTSDSDFGLPSIYDKSGGLGDGSLHEFIFSKCVNGLAGNISEQSNVNSFINDFKKNVSSGKLSDVEIASIEYWLYTQLSNLAKHITAVQNLLKTKNLDKVESLTGISSVFNDYFKGLTNYVENNLKSNSGFSSVSNNAALMNVKPFNQLDKLKEIKSASGSSITPTKAAVEFDKALEVKFHKKDGKKAKRKTLVFGEAKNSSSPSAIVLIKDDSAIDVVKNLLKPLLESKNDKWLDNNGDKIFETSPKLIAGVEKFGLTPGSTLSIINIQDYISTLAEYNKYEYLNKLDSLSSYYRYCIDQIAKARDVEVSSLDVIDSLYNFSAVSKTYSRIDTKVNDNELVVQKLTDEISFGDGYTASSINELAKKATENLEVNSYVWSKLWIMQYSYELALFNLNAALFGYFEDKNSIDGLEDGSVATDAAIQKKASDINKIQNKLMYAESQTNFNSVYGTNPLSTDEETKLILASLPWYAPDMKAFGKGGLAALQDRGYKSIGGDNSPYYNFQKIMYEIASAFDIAYSLGGSNEFDERGYGPDTLKKKLKEWESKNKDYNSETFDGNAINVNMVRSVIGLDKLCKLFRIEDNGWTEVIKLYRDKELVDGCYKYANNFLIQNSLTSEKTGLNPLGMFFDVKKKSMSKEWAKGFALSALFVPLQTNLNTAESTSYLNTEAWIKDFYYKYGFYRKGLYIDTDNSSVTNNFIKGSSGGRRPATLNDLMNYKRDITLYVDDNFYNLDKTVEVINRVNDGDGDVGNEFNKAASLAAIQTQQTQSATPAAVSSNSTEEIVNTPKSGMFGSMLGLVPEDILKSGSTSYYKDDIARSVKRLDVVDNNSGEGTYEKFVLGSKDITKVLDEDEYSIRQPYAVVSAVYRHRELYKELSKAISNEGAIFKSSNTIAQMPVALPRDYGTYMNYIMLSNLAEAMDNSVGLELDKDSPIFTDIFGNIISESGTVIIPAASNATLTDDYWSPVNLGFATYYGYSNKIPVDFGSDDFKEWLTGTVEIEEDVDYTGTPNNSNTATSSAMRIKRTDFSAKYKNHEQGSGWFTKGQKNYNLKTTTISAFDQSATVIWNTISKNSESLKKVFYENALYNIAPKMYSARLANHVVEVLRGAPIENINLSKEGLTGTRDVSKVGLTIAYGYEQLMKSIQPALNSSIVNMPNLAFVSGVEYVIMYIYKFMFAVFILIFIFTLYINAVKKTLSFKVFFIFILTVVGTVASITIIPDVISFSYYTACRDLLKDETSYIAMLNYNKELNGVELGVTEVSTPKTSTELYMKLDNLNVDWTTIMNKVLFNKTADTLTELYKEEFDKNLVSKQPGVIQKGDGLYLKMNDVLKSIEVVYNPDIKSLMIQNHSLDGNVLSYVSPYYVVLNELVNSINEYNFKQDIESYKVDENVTGKVTTKDVISAYLKSPEFLDKGYDITGFHKIYKTDSSLLPANNYNYYPTDSGDEGAIGLMKRSLWFLKNAGPELIGKVDKLADYARYYVAKNKDTIGKVPDEAFLKVMALSIAMEHNKIFNVPAGKSIEIANVDVADIMRFMIGKKSDVYRTFNLSYPRAVYELGGGASVIISVLYSIIIFFATYIKPGLIILILFMLIFNVIKEMVFSKERDGRKVLEGYLITCGLIIGVNYIYALMLAASIKVAQLGLGTFLSLLFGTIIQISYLFGLIMIFLHVIRDYRRIGLEAYQEAFGMLAQAFNGTKNKVSSKFSSWRTKRESVLKERSKIIGVSTDTNVVVEESAIGVEDVFGDDTVSSMESRDSSRYEEAFKSDI